MVESRGIRQHVNVFAVVSDKTSQPREALFTERDLFTDAFTLTCCAERDRIALISTTSHQTDFRLRATGTAGVLIFGDVKRSPKTFALPSGRLDAHIVDNDRQEIDNKSMNLLGESAIVESLLLLSSLETYLMYDPCTPISHHTLSPAEDSNSLLNFMNLTTDFTFLKGVSVRTCLNLIEN